MGRNKDRNYAITVHYLSNPIEDYNALMEEFCKLAYPRSCIHYLSFYDMLELAKRGEIYKIGIEGQSDIYLRPGRVGHTLVLSIGLNNRELLSDRQVKILRELIEWQKRAVINLNVI